MLPARDLGELMIEVALELDRDDAGARLTHGAKRITLRDGGQLWRMRRSAGRPMTTPDRPLRVDAAAHTFGAFRANISKRTMPVSVANSRIIYDSLKQCGIGLVSALPETWLVHL